MKLLLLILSLCYTLSSFTQQLVSGHVSDIKTGDKIGGATITSHTKQVVSKIDGSFDIAIYANHPLVISAVGYKTDTINVNAAKDFIHAALEPIANNLNDVIISGNMRAIQRSESAIPVEVYQAKFFRKNPTAGVFEALSTLNGVQPQLNCNICNTGDIHINGMEGPYTMVLIDGMPIISSLSRIYGFSGIPTSLVKRMEIVKGPASTLYGSDAVAGLINIITKDASSAGKFAADISFTSMEELNADLSKGFHLKKANGILGINLFNYWKKQDINNDNFTDVTQQRRVSVFNKWDIERENKLPFSISARYMAENRWGGELNWNKNYRGSDSIYGESIVTHRFELTGVYGLKGGKNDALLDYSYSYHNQESYYGTTSFDAIQHLAFAQLHGTRQFKNHQLLWGVPLRYTWYDDNTFLTQKDSLNKASKQITVAAFLQDEWKLGKQWLMLAGLRYEYNNLHGNVLSPRLAFKWQPNIAQTFRISTGNGYRIVNLFTEDHAALTGARNVVISENLTPEKSWNVNLNYTTQWMREKAFYNIDASLFYTRFSNKIIADYDTDPNSIIYDNLEGYAVSKGLSVNMEMAIKKGPKLLAGFTWMEVFAKEPGSDGITSKVPQLFAPKFSANYAASYNFPKWNTSIDLTGKLFGPQRLPIVPNDFRPGYSPWFTIMNLQVTKKINGQWELYTAVKNLLNFIPGYPILHPDDPFNKPGGKYFDVDNKPRSDTNPYGYSFDPSYSYAPMQGIKLMVGFRCNF
ncbi:MAG: TonB-dependent receptor [Bacteroidota bacterium]